MSSNDNNNMSSEISDSLLQDVNSQWIDQLDGAEEATSEHERSIDQADDVVEEASVADDRIPSVESDAEFELPQPLRQLIATGGVKLVAVPDGTWNIDGFAAKLRRTLSVTFSVDSTISSEDVVEAFCNAGVDAEDISSVQYRGSNRSWCVSFRNKAVKERVLEKGVVHFGNVAVFIASRPM